MLPGVIAGQSVVESVVITLIGDEDVGSELQSRRVVERPGCDKDFLRAVVLREETYGPGEGRLGPAKPVHRHR